MPTDGLQSYIPIFVFWAPDDAEDFVLTVRNFAGGDLEKVAFVRVQPGTNKDERCADVINMLTYLI